MTPETAEFLQNLADDYQAKGVTNPKVHPFPRKRDAVCNELLKLKYAEFHGTAKLRLTPKGWAWVVAHQAA